MRRTHTLTAIAALAACGTTATGEPVTFVVDGEASVTTLELCETITGSCDSDSSPIAGEIALDLNTPQDPASAAIIGFDFALTESLNLSYDLGFGQTLTITADDLATMYAGLEPTGFQPVGPAGELLFPAVPIVNSGTISYDTSSLLCIVFQSQNLPCSDTISLADVGEIVAPFVATLERQGDFLVLTVNISASFDGADLPDSPPIYGTITTTLQAVAPVPGPDCPPDVTGDGSVNLADLNLVLANFGQTTDDGDATGDGEVNLADLNAVLAAFGTKCP